MKILRRFHSRILDVAVVLVGAGLVSFLYELGILNPSAVLKSLVAVIACIALGHTTPKIAISLSLAAPFIGKLPIAASVGSLAEIMGSALCVGVMLRSIGREHAADTKVVRRLVVALGLMSLLVLLSLPHGDASTLSLLQAMVQAVTTAVAVTLLPLSVCHLARVAAPAGVVVAWAAYSTPELLVDRTTSTAGQNANGVGMVTALCVVLAVAGVANDRTPWRAFHAAAGIACGAGVLVSQSRGAFLTIAVAALVLSSGRLLTRRSIAGWVGLGLFAGLAAWVGAWVVAWAGVYTGRFASAQTESESLQSRQDASIYSLQQGVFHPVEGVGLTNLADFSYLNGGQLRVRSHVVYLGIWGEVGVIAACLFGVLCWRAFLAARRVGRYPLSVIVAVLVAGLSVNWWPLSGTGAIALAILAWGAGLGPGALPVVTARNSQVHTARAGADQEQRYRTGRSDD